MEDIAPRAPWSGGARWWCVIMGILLGAGALPAWRTGRAMDPASLAPYAAIAGVLLLAGIVPFPYGWRAALMLLVAVGTVVAGIAGLGPGAAITGAGEWSMLHLLAAICLPAALLFRERYRAYTGARYVLVTALILSLPFVGYCLLALGTATLPHQITAGIAVGAVCLSLLGFMGSNTTVAGIYLSALIVAAVTVKLGADMIGVRMRGDEWMSVDPASLWRLTGALSFAASAILGALGAAQLLAARSWAEARAVDLRPVEAERSQLPSIGSDTWSGRG